MPKNSWLSWQEAVKSLLEVPGKQRVHQMTGGSNVGGGGGYFLFLQEQIKGIIIIIQT
jgi:hypothetical protein